MGGLGLLGETGRLNALKTTVFEKSQLKFKTAANLTKPFNKCTHKPPPMSERLLHGTIRDFRLEFRNAQCYSESDERRLLQRPPYYDARW